MTGAGIELPTGAAAQQCAVLLAQQSPELVFVQLFNQRACRTAAAAAVADTAMAAAVEWVRLRLVKVVQRL